MRRKSDFGRTFGVGQKPLKLKFLKLYNLRPNKESYVGEMGEWEEGV